MSRAWVQFTARKRQPWNGEPYRWRHGPFATRGEAEDHELALRVDPAYARRVRIEVVITGERRPSHRDRTKAGMDRARQKGARIGRPALPFALLRARSLYLDGLSERAIAKRLGVSRTVIRRSLGGLKGVGSNSGKGVRT